jgi:hypothetical protein
MFDWKTELNLALNRHFAKLLLNETFGSYLSKKQLP